MESRSRLIEHSALTDTGVALYADARGSTFGTAAGVRDRGETIGYASYSECSRCGCAYSKVGPVTNAVRDPEPKFIQCGGIESMRPSDRASILAGAVSFPACIPDVNGVKAVTNAVICMPRPENMIVLREIPVYARIEPVQSGAAGGIDRQCIDSNPCRRPTTGPYSQQGLRNRARRSSRIRNVVEWNCTRRFWIKNLFGRIAADSRAIK